MRTMKPRLAALALLLTTAFASVPALADGLAAKESMLPDAARRSLRAEIAADRAKQPELYAAVRDVRGVRPEVYRRHQNPKPVADRELKALGSRALLPMLDALAFDAPPRGALTDEEQSVLASGMLEAVGVLRDARSGPVLRAVFEKGTTDERVRASAARAMGRLCTDAELAILIEHAQVAAPRRTAAVAGLGECKRLESARHLASLLGAATDAAWAETLATALGAVGSSWAWKAMGPASEAQGAAVREAATVALVAGFVRHTGATRARIGKSILMTEHPGTSELLARSRGAADADARAALDALDTRIVKRPAR
jgi:hypothetical protein